MPVYEYKCTVCQERFEVEQSFTEEPLTALPGCQDAEHQLKKVFSPVGIAFRGGGFYRNEARGSTKAADSPKTESSSEPSSSSSGDKASASSSTSSSSSSTSSD